MTDANLTRKERDRLLRETDFLDAAEQLFAERGYYQTSMEDVAKAAEYATGTIYRYFPSKEALYNSILVRKGHAYIKMITGVLDEADSPTDKMSLIIHHEVDFWFDNAQFMRIYMNVIDKPCDPMNPPEGFQDIHSRYIEILTGILEDGMKKGEFIQMNVEMLLLALMGVSHNLLTNIISAESDVSKQEVESFMKAFFRTGFIKKRTKGI